MNRNGISRFDQARIEWAIRLKYLPLPDLDMNILATQLNAMRIGDLRQIGKTFEVMMERDGELAVNSDKRKSDAAGLEWQIVSDGSADGDKHAQALQYFYDNLTATQALDQDDTGGVDQLLYQLFSALDNKYSAHEMLLRVDNAAAREVTAEFRHTPMWFFESRRGYLGYLQHIFDLYGQPCVQGEWLTAVGAGWMRPLSMAFAMKMFPLKDWLLFCTRYGSGFLDATTDATVDSPEWDQAQEALRTLANDGAVLHNNGVEFKFLESAAKNSLPFHPIVEMVNGLYAKCYRGVDLATGSRNSQSGQGGSSGGGSKSPVGASVQKEESGIFLIRDARWSTGVLNERVDRPIIRYLFNQEPRAWFALLPPLDDTSEADLAALQGLVPMGLKVALAEVYKRFRWSVPRDGEPVLAPAATAPPGAGPDEAETPSPANTPGKSTGQNSGKNTKPNPKPGAAKPQLAPAPRRPAAMDATGEETDVLMKEEGPDAPTAPARTNERSLIAPGADAAIYQTASANMPTPQVDASGFWSRAALAPKGADGQTLPMPSLGYAIPNQMGSGLNIQGARFQRLEQLGLGNSRAAQSLRRSMRASQREEREFALANAAKSIEEQLAEELKESLAMVLQRLDKIIRIADADTQKEALEKLLADFPAIAEAIQADDSLANVLEPVLVKNFLLGLHDKPSR